MADGGSSDQLQDLEGYEEPSIAVSSTLSLVSCGVLLASAALRRASWTPYVLLWTLSKLLLKLLHVIEVIVMQTPSILANASTVSCEFYHTLKLALPFLFMTAIAALSLDRLLSSVKPCDWEGRGPRYLVVVGLLVGSVVLFVPFFTTYHYHRRRYITDLPIPPPEPSPAAYFLLLYVHWTTITLDLLVAFVGAAGFWRLQKRKREQRSRLLAPFLLGLVLLSLPSSLITIFFITAIYELNILQILYRVCFFFGPVLLLGYIITSAIVLRDLKKYLPFSRLPTKKSHDRDDQSRRDDQVVKVVAQMV